MSDSSQNGETPTTPSPNPSMPPETWLRYTFKGHNGYLLPPQECSLLALGHTALAQSWRDSSLHTHTASEEYYLLLVGTLHFQVLDFQLSLQPNELLMLHPGVPHAITGGEGRIEHFGMRAPSLNDKILAGEITPGFSPSAEHDRLLVGDWGQRVPLGEPRFTNCWLFGSGSARFTSRFIALANLNFPTYEAANAGIGTRHQLHLHQSSWEYYTVLQGEKTLLIDGEQVQVHPGEILAVPPGSAHTLFSRQAPFRGFTLRTPLLLDDKIGVES